MKKMRHVVRHAWIREGHPWPEDVPRELGHEKGKPDLYTKLVHVAARPTGTDLDIWWTESMPAEEE